MSVAEERIHYNKFQLKVILVGAKNTYVVASRGTGKSEKIISHKSQHNMHSMPRCSGLFVGPNYKKMLEHLLPKIISGWGKLGFVRDVHYVIGHAPPKVWKWQKPYNAPVIFDHYISWYTGAGIQLLSQDRKVTSNGLDVDFIHGDEAKQLNYERLKTELFPTNRGNKIHFGHLPEHHEMLFCTDKFLGKNDSNWFKTYQAFHDDKLVETIILMQHEISRLKNLGEPTEKLEKDLVAFQKQCTYYAEADVFDNVHAVGLEFIADQLQNLSLSEFRAALLNEDVYKVESGFYAALDEAVHGYEATNYNHIDKLGYNFNLIKDADCRHDSDNNESLPLDIGIDWGGRFNCLVVMQNDKHTACLIKDFFAYPPYKYMDLLAEFMNYYRFRKNKHVRLFYDVSGNRQRDHSIYTASEDIELALRKAGWTVSNMCKNKNYIAHNIKFSMWSKILDESIVERTLPKFRFNINNAKTTYNSMCRAKVKLHGSETRKDKSEENKDIQQELATHLSDAVDYIVCNLNVNNSTWSKL